MNCIIGIFVDFSNAFDTVDHKILSDKLYHYGIRGSAYELFHSYLFDRKQFSTYNGVSSATKYTMCGVPQGSILVGFTFLNIRYFSNTLVLTSSIDVVFILSIRSAIVYNLH